MFSTCEAVIDSNSCQVIKALHLKIQAYGLWLRDGYRQTQCMILYWCEIRNDQYLLIKNNMHDESYIRNNRSPEKIHKAQGVWIKEVPLQLVQRLITACWHGALG